MPSRVSRMDSSTFLFMMLPHRECSAALLSTVVALAIAALIAPLSAQETPPDPVPQHDTLMLPSRALGEARRINVHTPASYAASDTARFPVLYMPDGGLDEDFPHVVNTVDSLIALGAIRPVIVVGVPNTERRRDLTGPTRVKTDSAIAPHVGGSAEFRRFWHDELVPVIDAHYRTTSGACDRRRIARRALHRRDVPARTDHLRPLHRVRSEPLVESRRARRFGNCADGCRNSIAVAAPHALYRGVAR